MISFDEASRLILEAAEPLESTNVPVDDCVGYVLAEDIISSVDVSPFCNSAMDGFAVRAERLKGCSTDSPLELTVATTVYAGDSTDLKGTAGKAVRIMTGAPVPSGYDTVVRFEDCTHDAGTVTFTVPATTGANVRQPGEDISIGQKLFSVGDCIGELDTGILASVGRAEVAVHRKPTVLIAATGDELVPPGRHLKPGQIYNSNDQTIRSMVRRFGKPIESSKPIADSSDALANALASDCDVVITSGGVSAGDRDLLVSTAEQNGWCRIFHKARIKPGKPIYAARRGRQLLFGLPGNPLSTAVTCAVFVIPALKKMSGISNYQLRLSQATLSPDSIRKSGRMLIWPGSIKGNGASTIVEFSPKKSSAALSALLGSDGLIFQTATDDRSQPEVRAIRWRHLLNA